MIGFMREYRGFGTILGGRRAVDTTVDATSKVDPSC